MAKKAGKHVENARKKVEARPYKLSEAAELLKTTHHTKFDETVELAINLGVDPKHSDQVVRGTVVLPNGLGKSVRVLVIAGGDKVREAQDAGADFVGGDDMVQKIMEGWTDYDAVIATPDMMRSAGKLGKVLGPRGLMPNPKTGTVTFDVAKAIKDVKAGKVEFRVDKAGIVHCAIGKIKFDAAKLAENAHAVIAAVVKAKPSASKGKYVKKITLTSAMVQGITVENDTKLRPAVQAAGGKYQVVKNTLVERAGAGTPTEKLLKDLKGTNSIAYSEHDPVALAKALTKIAKDVPAFQFKAGLVEGRVISIAEIQQLANLPSKEELLSKVMFLLNAPAQRIAMALNALPRNLAITVSEAIKANKFASTGASAGDAGSGEKKSEPAPEAVPAGTTEASNEKGQ